MTSSLRTALHFPVVHHPRTMRKPNPERDLLASQAGILVVRAAVCEERLAGIGLVRNWPRNIYLPGSGVWPPNFYPSNTRSGHLPPYMQHFTPIFGDHTTCCLPLLGQHILDYEPPCGFFIPPFDMYDDSSDPYDHMLHFNQAMILNAGNDRLLCKVFPTSLKGPALAWFHKLPRGSLNSFSELWAIFVFQYLCSVRQKGNISSLQSIFKRDDESIRDFTRRFGQAVQQIDTYSMDAVL